MVVIRLSRGGSKKHPFYSILVADQRRSARGRFIERIGFFNPVARGKEEKLRLDTERLEHWVKTGAQLSDRVRQLYGQVRSESATESVAEPTVEPKAEPVAELKAESAAEPVAESAA